MIIDFHVHTFPAKISAKAVKNLGIKAHIKYYTDGSEQGLLASMEKAGVHYSVNQPVMTNVAQVEKINRQMAARQEEMISHGIIPFGGFHPEYKDVEKEMKLLHNAGIRGIKLHPAYQNVRVDTPNMMRIIDAASSLDMIVLIHAGIDIGIYDQDYASVEQILHVIDTVHPPKFVLAHMGGWGEWKVVEKYLAGAPVWLDTSFSLGPLRPSLDIMETDPNTGQEVPAKPILDSNMNPQDFVRLCRKHGTDRILFATDSPWEDQSEYIAWTRNCGFSKEEEDAILGENAARLLHLSEFLR